MERFICIRSGVRSLESGAKKSPFHVSYPNELVFLGFAPDSKARSAGLQTPDGNIIGGQSHG